MSLIKAPPELQIEGNLSDNWKKFKRDFNNFFIASEKDKKSDAIKIAILQSYIGESGLKLLESFHLSDEDAAKYAFVIDKFEEFCNPRKNIVMERFKFLKTQQREGESFNEFLITLKLRISTCKFGDQEDSILRDMVIVGLRDTSVQERLLRETDITFEKAVKFIKAAEESQSHLKTLKEINCSVAEDVNVVNKSNNNNNKPFKSSSDNNNFSKNGNCSKNGNFVKNGNLYRNDNNNNQNRNFSSSQRGNQNQANNFKNNGQSSKPYDCKKCGRTHKPMQCYAFGKQCSNCKKLNHFACGCMAPKSNFSNNNQSNSSNKKSVNEVYEGEPLFVQTIFSKLKSKWHEKVNLNNKINVNFKMDTGADISVLNYEVFKKLRIESEPLENNLYDFNNHPIETHGSCSIFCSTPKVENVKIKFAICKNRKSVLGGDDCENLSLIKRLNEVIVTDC